MSINLVNFRELGGIKTEDKRQIKHGLFFRGPALVLDRLAYEDKKELDKIGFKHIIDLRGKDEVARAGQLYLPGGSTYHHIPAITIENEIAHDDLDTLASDEATFEDAYIARIYRSLPFSNKAYKFFFECIKKEEVPIYYHCSAGKDRTGVLSCLLELMLGVKREEIFRDYLNSKVIYEDYYKRILNLKEIDPSWLVYDRWLDGTLKAILLRYKDYDDYFLKEFGIDQKIRTELKDKYLE